MFGSPQSLLLFSVHSYLVSVSVCCCVCADDDEDDDGSAAAVKTFLSSSGSGEMSLQRTAQLNCSWFRYATHLHGPHTPVTCLGRLAAVPGVQAACGLIGYIVSPYLYPSTSPARYPSSFYSGPPIPLNFEEVDTSTDDRDSPSECSTPRGVCMQSVQYPKRCMYAVSAIPQEVYVCSQCSTPRGVCMQSVQYPKRCMYAVSAVPPEVYVCSQCSTPRGVCVCMHKWTNPLSLTCHCVSSRALSTSPGRKCLSLSCSRDSSFSYTPNSKPSLDEQVMLRSANSSVNIGPKNLMEVRLVASFPGSTPACCPPSVGGAWAQG